MCLHHSARNTFQASGRLTGILLWVDNFSMLSSRSLRGLGYTSKGGAYNQRVVDILFYSIRLKRLYQTMDV